MYLTIIVLTRNSLNLVKDMLESVWGLYDELLVGDAGSTDGTLDLLKKYSATIVHQKEGNLGQRKQELIKKASGDWILVLDSDERVSPELYQQIKSFTHSPRRSHGLSASRRISLPPSGVVNTVRQCVAYRIPYQNYVFGKPVYYGGEIYSKVRLFQRGHGRISNEPIHEEIIVNGVIDEFLGVIHHHSYRSLRQVMTKFFKYAYLVAIEKKKNRETVSLAKLFLYGPHMVWARFIKEKGYKDGFHGLVLALSFGYMEALTYWLLLFI